ncbi:hypothetical protein N8342_11165 [Acidimicrobiales bacterium]|nr:hypothetical protein [Acidimicrobiales bacterium]HAY69975.1 hypothetical protein [Acidimicrobiaceae bacterium]
MNGDERTEPIDLEALDVGPMLRHARTATFAPNWKAVLLADATVGLAIIALGVFLATWIALIGWPVVAVGVVYVFLVVRRALQWRWLRNKAGLS